MADADTSQMETDGNPSLTVDNIFQRSPKSGLSERNTKRVTLTSRVQINRRL
jgi:hypothetical protein